MKKRLTIVSIVGTIACLVAVVCLEAMTARAEQSMADMVTVVRERPTTPAGLDSSSQSYRNEHRRLARLNP